jgi:1,4-dihydroxy-2-naphthoate octaprenyltransferase
VIGFFTVCFCQGSLIFFISYHAVDSNHRLHGPVLANIIATLLIGALYPLTQIYQHEEDRRDGVTTISYLLGKRGSFVFSGILFSAATTLMYVFSGLNGKPEHFTLFLVCTMPVVLYFLYWLSRVWKNDRAADFGNSLRMNILATLCTTAYFITLIFLNH